MLIQKIQGRRAWCSAVSVVALAAAGSAQADSVTDWNVTAMQIISKQTKSPAIGNHTMAMVQTAVYEAVNAITQKYPAGRFGIKPVAAASVDAAVVSATRSMLNHLIPMQKEGTENAFATAMRNIGQGVEASAGTALGEQAAQAVIDWRKTLKAGPGGPYRPATRPGVYVPTPNLAGFGWRNRPTWNLASAQALRPPAPPALDSEQWANDYNEVLKFGAKESPARSAADTEKALFWRATQITIYYPVLQSFASSPGRDITRNARLFAAAAQAMDDGLVSVFDAKYHYRFWRPVTAIRNGDEDGNDATERVADWTPLIPTPMHPEYPCAHCIVSGAIAGVLEADLDGAASPKFATTSPALPKVTRSWQSPAAFAQEVADARVLDGVHYRTSVKVGTTMGRQIGALAWKHSISH